MTNKIYIAECLEQMKQILPIYKGKVKLIYIDPPYNTKKSFTYNDTQPDWDKFIEERITIAKEFLSEDGIICVSINEDNNCRIEMILNKVFDKITTLIWQTKKGGASNAKHIATNHEYVKVYAKNIKKAVTYRFALGEERLKAYNKIDDRGAYTTQPFDIKPLAGCNYTITLPNGKKQHSNNWRMTEANFKKHLVEDRIYFTENNVHKKIYSHENRVVLRSLLTDVGSSREATKEQKDIFGKRVFDYPKPTKLLKKIIEYTTQEGDIVMDFFAGTGTTAVAAKELNRNYIVIQQEENGIEDLLRERLK